MSVWIAETLLATTVLMALVLMLRRPVARYLGAGAAYMLWALPLARMILPPLPTDVVTATPLQSAVDQTGLVPLFTTPAAALPTDAASFPWIELGAAIWIMGAAAVLLFHAIGYIRFRRLMLTDALPLSRDGRIRIIASPRASGPLAFGIIHPYVAVPLDFDTRFDADERAMALAHECTHHRRGDLAANMIALAVLALHWCNPIAWIAWVRYRADQELACDARVLACHGPAQAHAYGRAILKAAGGPTFAAACHLTRLDTLKGRLQMLSNHAESLHRISWGMAAVALVTLGGLALTASGSRAAREMAVLTDTASSVNMSRLSSLVTQPQQAAAIPATPTEPMPAAAPADTVAQWDNGPASPAPPAPYTPPAPPAPTADMVPPVPSVPSAPPARATREDGRTAVAHAYGRTETHNIPTAADIRRMVPVVDVRNGCDGDELVSQRTTTLSDGRQSIRLRVCTDAIARQGQQEAAAGREQARMARQQAMAEASAARAQADKARQEGLAEAAAGRAEASRARQEGLAQAAAGRAEARMAREQTLTQLAAERANIARDQFIPAQARASALRQMDTAIARIRSHKD